MYYLIVHFNRKFCGAKEPSCLPFVACMFACQACGRSWQLLLFLCFVVVVVVVVVVVGLFKLREGGEKVGLTVKTSLFNGC